MKWFVRGPPSRPYGLYLYFLGLKRGSALDLFVKRSRGSGFEGSECRSRRVTAFLIDETSEQTGAWIRLRTRSTGSYWAYQGIGTCSEAFPSWLRSRCTAMEPVPRSVQGLEHGLRSAYGPDRRYPKDGFDGFFPCRGM